MEEIEHQFVQYLYSTGAYEEGYFDNKPDGPDSIP
jgi:hypothetical protein